jgi:hypothetical protein
MKESVGEMVSHIFEAALAIALREQPANRP